MEARRALTAVLLSCGPILVIVIVLGAWGTAATGPASAPATPGVSPGPPPASHEGYGSLTVGGAGADTCRVTSLEAAGPGTLRDCIATQSGPRRIVFEVGGTIPLVKAIRIRKPFLTIDGSTAPSPGITLRQGPGNHGLRVQGTHDIIIRHLRLWGVFAGDRGRRAKLLEIDGDAGPDQVASRIVLDHLTVRNAGDSGPDIWGEVRDVTISWCLMFYSRHPTTISHRPAPYQTRLRISLHHNVWASNGERHPQVRADVRELDYVNNIVYDWGYNNRGFGYGVRIRNVPGEPKVNANLVNNAFIPKTVGPEWALVYGRNPGPDADDGGPWLFSKAQGTVVTTSKLGKLWVSGNILPPENKDHYSTVAAALPVPPHARVTTWPAWELGAKVLPSVGMKHRDATEQELLDEIAAARVWRAP